MSASATLDNLKDINPIWVIEDFSFFILAGIIFTTGIIIYIIYAYVKKLRDKKLKQSLRININSFNTIEAKEIKEFAYESTKILNQIISTLDIKNGNNPFIKKHTLEEILKTKEEINKFIEHTNNYKYKPNQEAKIDKDTLQKYQNMRECLNVYI